MLSQQSDIQKCRELQFVECAARLLGQNWQAQPHERPDFIVSCDDASFAMEVTEIHLGPKNRKGSEKKKAEAANSKWLKSIRTEFDPNSEIPLNLKFLGSATDAARQSILTALRSEHFDQRPILHRLVTKFSEGKLWVTKEFHQNWGFLNDEAGWVSQDCTYLQEAISKKSSKINAYRIIHPDVRLLVVAERKFNSGKIFLENDSRVDLMGFNAVYFLSYPTQAFQILSLENLSP